MACRLDGAKPLSETFEFKSEILIGLNVLTQIRTQLYNDGLRKPPLKSGHGWEITPHAIILMQLELKYTD